MHTVLLSHGTAASMIPRKNTNLATVQTQRHLPDVDIFTPATRTFFFQVFVILAKMSRLLVSKNLNTLKSIKTWFPTFLIHPLSLKTPPFACLRTLKVFVSLAAEIVWNLLWRYQNRIHSYYFRMFFLGNVKVWAVVKTVISIFENYGYLHISESLLSFQSLRYDIAVLLRCIRSVNVDT